MRGYLPVTAEEISDFLSTGSMECGPLYAPTIKFLTANNDMDDEQGEYILSMLAADEAIEMRKNPAGAAFILALEISDEQVAEHGENFVNLKENGRWEDVQCAFLVSPDGEELTWFATQEISEALPNWLKA
ncbi:unannotated protein [freshwater metagenome]|uniref:Unannotated protein n=2 Tax=freshwater metagenome TaxID=449393 RepID=A0A6J6VET3_9ZZZZ|nr:hypothetical protein [Actinomycetota bacterium]